MKNLRIGHLIYWWPILFFTLFISFWPVARFNDPYSTVIEDVNGVLLDARIASDGQWRFPLIDTVPEGFQMAIQRFEDKRFLSHTGFDPLGFARAMNQNIQAGSVVSGGSTLTMQVVRLSRKGQSRTVVEKVIELLQSVAVEWQYSKDEIMRLYASHAPYGGNIVGLEAASWRYFSLAPDRLSHGEYASLAVLPNAPSLVFPGKNEATLLAKRNRLIDKLELDSETKGLAKSEPIPGKVKRLPQIAPHLLNRSAKEHPGERIKTTVLFDLQEQASNIVNRHSYQLQASNHIYNAAALIADVKTGKVLAYVGNTTRINEDHGNDVDIIVSRRSTGSILKPMLYASMQETGELLPKSLVYDIPTFIGGYSPKNFNLRYDGAVPADQALSRSLNIPAVRMLQDYGIDRFREKLVKLGLKTIDKSAAHYGLSLILGGGESTVWELAGAYASMARTLSTYNGEYDKQTFHSLHYEADPAFEKTEVFGNKVLNASSIYLAFDALQNVNRPEQELGWEYFASTQKIAWKTGTSFGFRDAWSIGTTPEYVVAVWVGNADGEGRPGLTGVSAAAPIMFDLFRALDKTSWFEPPFDEMKKLQVCSASGMLPGPNCNQTDTALICETGSRSEPCPYHQTLNVSHDHSVQLTAACADLDQMQAVSWLVLPPAVAHYYKIKHPGYKSKPPFKIGCGADESQVMQLIYPRNASQIFIPREMDGTKGAVIFEIAHQEKDAELFWHLDDEFVGQTSGQHQLHLSPVKGEHQLVVVDQTGNIMRKHFEIVN